MCDETVAITADDCAVANVDMKSGTADATFSSVPRQKRQRILDPAMRTVGLRNHCVLCGHMGIQPNRIRKRQQFRVFSVVYRRGI